MICIQPNFAAENIIQWTSQRNYTMDEMQSKAKTFRAESHTASKSW